MDIYSITELALKYIKCILKKAIMLILRSWYLIMLFFVILFSLIMVLISFVCFVTFATGNTDIGSALLMLFINLFCVLGNILVAVIAWFIDHFTFKTHIVFALVHAFCGLLVVVSAVLGIFL